MPYRGLSSDSDVSGLFNGFVLFGERLADMKGFVSAKSPFMPHNNSFPSYSFR